MEQVKVLVPPVQFNAHCNVCSHRLQGKTSGHLPPSPARSCAFVIACIHVCMHSSLHAFMVARFHICSREWMRARACLDVFACL
eukprot:1462641-Pleurochrysis_carterae.AAC.4